MESLLTQNNMAIGGYERDSDAIRHTNILVTEHIIAFDTLENEATST